MIKKHQVFFVNRGFSREVPENTLIGDILRSEDPQFSFPCNGQGTCGKCRIKVSGNLNPPTAIEKKHIEPAELALGIRLACRTRVCNSITVELPDTFDHNESLTGSILNCHILQSRQLDLLYQQRLIAKPDIWCWENIAAKLPPGCEPTLDLLRQIPGLSKSSGQFWVEIFAGKAISISITVPQPKYAVAIDIGTTTLAAFLIDFQNTRIAGTVSAFNPQAAFGADVISRIMYAQNQEGLTTLHETIIQAITGLIRRLAGKAGIDMTQILQVNLVGNTCMLHLLLRVNPGSMGEAPFTPSFIDMIETAPAELGIDIHKDGLIYILPGIGGFVGADISAGILACELTSEKTELLIDIGTNGELVITGKGKMFACSTAAGPAFEGAKISCGILAGPGAITDVQWVDGGQPVLMTIDNLPPRGICGTGLFRVMVEFLKRGIITRNGSFNTENRDSNYDTVQQRYYLLRDSENPIFITQQDIREFQLAKGAIRAGVELIQKKLGISSLDLETIYLAGAFGNHINPGDAVFLGLLPSVPLEKIKIAGNTAGTGAIISILSQTARQELINTVKTVEHIELANSSDFTDTFTEAMLF